MIFYLGIHRPAFLERSSVPMFISARAMRLTKRRYHPKCRWALDSGGFSELSMYGKWMTKPRQYVDEVLHWQTYGKMDWAAIQDHMCEPFILAKTKRTLLAHQTSTVRNLLRLESLAPSIPWAPVLQGWKIKDYMRHVKMYERAGIDLRKYKVVGVGSVCRRQATTEVKDIMRELCNLGLQLHGFGIKMKGIVAVAKYLKSADSMAWSYRGRMSEDSNNANKLEYALAWRKQLLGMMKAG